MLTNWPRKRVSRYSRTTTSLTSLLPSNASIPAGDEGSRMNQQLSKVLLILSFHFLSHLVSLLYFSFAGFQIDLDFTIPKPKPCIRWTHESPTRCAGLQMMGFNLTVINLNEHQCRRWGVGEEGADGGASCSCYR